MKIVDIVGARPQFIKLAPILRAVNRYNENPSKGPVKEVLVHTGQHYDYEMSKVFFDDLNLKAPDHHLGVGSGTHAFQTSEMLKGVEDVLSRETPDLVMVYGDTNTTLAGALAAAKLLIPVAHVEAGLRSFNRRMPEEVNRVLTDHISDVLFCPTGTAVRNLNREGITEGVHLVGDVMYDSVLQYAEVADSKSDVLDRLGLKPGEYALATVHRAENTGSPESIGSILTGISWVAERTPVIFPMHPRTRKTVSDLDRSFPGESMQDRLRIVEPMPYLDMIMLEKNAKAILTDSGGVQKEAFFFKVPCITLREETEWVETVESGWNVLAGSDPGRAVEAFLSGKPELTGIHPYGMGDASEKIIGILCEAFS